MNSKIVLIHNNEIERLYYIRPLLTKLSRHFGLNFEEISNQNLHHVNLICLIIKKIQLEIMNLKLGKYWNIDGRRKLLHFIDVIKFIYKIVFSKKYRTAHTKRIGIEDALTIKHIEAISNFANSSNDNDVLIVFESDAYIEDIEYLEIVTKHVLIDAACIDLFQLTFPFTFDELNLKISKDYFHKINNVGIIDYPRFIMNTTACYAISSNLAKKIEKVFMSKNNRKLFAADFFLNFILYKISLDSDFKNREITRIFHPSPVLNGSISKLYKSTIQSKDKN